MLRSRFHPVAAPERARARLRAGARAVLLGLLVSALPAAAQPEADPEVEALAEVGAEPAASGGGDALEAEAEAAPVSATAPVSLDSLLELPDSVEVGVDRRGKATENEWRSRFVNAHLELAGARRDLAESQQALEEVASSGQWAFSPPGVNVDANANVDSHRLRMDIKRQRAEVERAERGMRELEVEANLANVPEAWREAPSPE